MRVAPTIQRSLTQRVLGDVRGALRRGASRLAGHASRVRLRDGVPTRIGSHARGRARRAAPGWSTVLALVAALLTGCLGYRPLTGRMAFGDAGGGAIEIRIVQNTTGEIGLNGMLVDALQEEFARRGVLAPVYPDQGRVADLLLAASIISARAEPTAFSSVALTLEDRIEVVLNVSVERSSSRETVLSRKAVRYAERFLASADPQVYESNKEQALRRIAARAAGQIHDDLAQAF
jgi:hypothetical protein